LQLNQGKFLTGGGRLSEGHLVTDPLLSALKGFDAFLFDLICRTYPDANVSLLPVLIQEQADWDTYEGESDGYSSLVYPLNLESLQGVTASSITQAPSLNELSEEGEGLSSQDGNKKTQDKNDNQMDFYSLDGSKPYCWSHFKQDSAEYTGNESQPGEMNSIYLNLAILKKGPCRPL
jgi:hypothetical protein